jgi:hypothetical protein
MGIGIDLYVNQLENKIDSLEFELEEKEQQFQDLLVRHEGMVNKLNFYADLFIELEERYNTLIEGLEL